MKPLPNQTNRWTGARTEIRMNANAPRRPSQLRVRRLIEMNKEYLTTLVNSFVVRNRRARFLEFLASERRYSDFLDGLLHDPRHFDPQVVVELPGNEHTASNVLSRLRALGGGDEAYLVGDCGEFKDGHVANLETLLHSCVGSMEDALVYCLKGHVAYYEGHEGFRLILRRVPN
jgi:hypothetical protein